MSKHLKLSMLLQRGVPVFVRTPARIGVGCMNRGSNMDPNILYIVLLAETPKKGPQIFRIPKCLNEDPCI